MRVLARAPDRPSPARLAYPHRLAVRGLIFDMAGVLHDATLWWRWLARLLARLGAREAEPALRGRWENEHLPDVVRGRREHGEALEAFLAAAGLTSGQVDEAAFAAETRRRELLATLRPLPGVPGTIEQLHAGGLALAVLTNADAPAPALEARLARLGLAGRFAAVVSSFDLERTLPDAACYEAALAALGLSAGEAAYVGSSRICLAGAAGVGLGTIAFNHEPDAAADLRLNRFVDLLDALEWSSAAVAP